jgi:diketogulonate reductase-like aldo/keto reductase
MLSYLLHTSLVASAFAAEATTVEVAPGIFLPYVSDGVIFDTANSSLPLPSEEIKGLELFLSLGGRGVDTAWSYFNQKSVGEAIREERSASRNEIFLTTKIECMGTAESAYAAIQRDLNKLNLSYVDMVLIHAPYKAFGEPYSNCTEGAAGVAARQATWKGMEKAVKDGLTRGIGVSNFNATYLAQILQGAEIPPAVNQCCLSVGNSDNATIEFSKAQGITYQAWSPLGGKDIGGISVLDFPELKAVAANHPGKNTAQVALRWLKQNGHPFVTATGKEEYIKSDLGIFDWELTASEMAQLNSIRVNDTYCDP